MRVKDKGVKHTYYWNTSREFFTLVKTTCHINKWNSRPQRKQLCKEGRGIQLVTLLLSDGQREQVSKKQQVLIWVKGWLVQMWLILHVFGFQINNTGCDKDLLATNCWLSTAKLKYLSVTPNYVLQVFTLLQQKWSHSTDYLVQLRGR